MNKDLFEQFQRSLEQMVEDAKKLQALCCDVCEEDVVYKGKLCEKHYNEICELCRGHLFEVEGEDRVLCQPCPFR
jgi:hypothetical protein